MELRRDKSAGQAGAGNIPALPGEEISTIQFPNKFQYSDSKNQTENMSVCDLKYGSEIYLEIGLWKFGRTRQYGGTRFQ
jgi:hypothetical protein